MEMRLSHTENPEPSNPLDPQNPPVPPWWHALVRCNPFYLFSSLCLVYGIYRVAIDPFFLKRDLLQLLFSFGSLELYGAMLVFTAIWLARKSIWYDSTLLVFLGNMLVLMPFMLVSHAVFMQDGLATTICLAATLLAAAKFGSFKRFFPGLNLPAQSLFLGALVLCVNVTLPLLFRRGMDADIELWAARRDYFWFIVLPLLALLGSILPSPSSGSVQPKAEHQQPWIPLISYLLWIAGTAANLYIIDYVDEQEFGLANITVLAWSLAWLLVMRVRDFLDVQKLSPLQMDALLLLPLCATLLAFANQPHFPIALHLLNALIYALLAVRHHAKTCAMLAAASAALALMAVPEAAVAAVIKGYRKELLLPALTAVAGLWVSLRSRTAKGALLGAFCIALIAGWALRSNPWGAHAIFQISTLYLLAHSLFWKGEQERAAALLRVCAAIVWTADCILLQDNPATARAGYLLPLLMLPLAALAWFRLRFHALLLTAAALLAWLALPLYTAALWITHAPLGVIAILGGFALFALGTWFALWRKPASFI